MLNLYLKLSLTSFKNKFSKNNWHYINHMSVLNQEILINPEFSHACENNGKTHHIVSRPRTTADNQSKSKLK